MTFPIEPIINLECAEHGPMRFRLNMGCWDCAGFDGEGCEVKVTLREFFDILGGHPLIPAPYGWTSHRYIGPDALTHIDIRILRPGLREAVHAP